MDALNFKTSIETKTAVGLVSPLQLITKNYDYLTLYMSLHYQNQRPNPNQLTIFKHTLLLHKAYNSDSMSNDWTHFNIQDMCVKFHNISKYLSTKIKILEEQLVNMFPEHWLETTALGIQFESKFIEHLQPIFTIISTHLTPAVKFVTTNSTRVSKIDWTYRLLWLRPQQFYTSQTNPVSLFSATKRN